MDGWAHPNVAVQLGSECVWRCGCSAECCRRLMGGGGNIVSAPTKQEGASRASVHMQGLCVLAWCKHLNSELGAQTALHLSVSKGVIQRKRESQSSATSSSNDNSRPGPMAQAVHTGMKYILFT